MSGAPGSWPRAGRAGVRVGAVVLSMAVVTAVVLGVAALVAGESPGGGSWTIAPVLGAALAAAALWAPGRRWAEGAAGRLVDGGRRDPEEVVRTFGRRTGSNVPDDDLLVQLAEALVRVFRAASAEVWRDPGTGALEQLVAVPQRERAVVALDDEARRILTGGGVVGRAWLEMWQPQLLDDRPFGEVRVVPAVHGGALLGLVVVARLAGGDRFTTEEDASLAELGGRLGVVLHNRELNAALRDTLEDLRRTNAELRASRVRLVSTADAERRRIERDLHDGAQQHLVALAVNLRLAADEVIADPGAVRDVFAALDRDVRKAIDELRSLAHGIYPPLLLDAGLVEALTVSARRSPSVVTLTADGVGRYRPDVEAAIYFCCMEALQNAAKHAPGAAVRVHLEHDGAALYLTVDDDGPGLPSGATGRGHGLENMADRLGAVGGTLELTTGPTGGTRVRGEVPVDVVRVDAAPVDAAPVDAAPPSGAG